MKDRKTYLLALILIFITSTFSHANTDSLTFEVQRTKVNSMLDARAKKFGEYDISLEEKSGIFGLYKTKNDIQKSINILQEIVKTDNNIFIETRKLLKIKDQQAEKYQELAAEYDNQVTAYMRTISKLQTTHDKLTDEIEDHEDDDNNDRRLYFIFGGIIISLLLIILKQHKKIKTQKLTKL